MNILNPDGPISTNQLYLLASATNIDANTVASTSLNWTSNLNASNTLPMFARVRRVTGTLSLMIATIRLNTTIIQPVSALQSALLGAAANPLIYSLSSATSISIIPSSGNWDFNVTTFNGSAATVSVEIWGIYAP